MNEMTRDVVIVGGGLAAVRTAQGLRDLGFEGSITLASEEARLPYDRPPLSKDFLRGKASTTTSACWPKIAWPSSRS